MPGPWLVRSGGAEATADGVVAAATDEQPRAVLLGLDVPKEGPERLAELERLARTDGVSVVGRVVQPPFHPARDTCLGPGKVDELARLVADESAALVIADGDLSPVQARELEDQVGARVVDRTALILDIFGQHARGSEGKAKVELAQLTYQLPRLGGPGTEASEGDGSATGDAGTGVRGPGERLERERRSLRRRMALLRRQLALTGRRRERSRFRRRHHRVPSVALTGYTNAGKSALLNRLTGADVPVEDALFATLDPTVRRVWAADGVDHTVVDTVGFVHDLPQQLADSFRSTLQEVADADLVLHVVDASSPDALAQITTVRGVLDEIGAPDRPELLALNKVDVAPPERLLALRDAHPDALPVSAVTGEGIAELRAAIVASLPG
jgi:GTP-binding protein HflX